MVNQKAVRAFLRSRHFRGCLVEEARTEGMCPAESTMLLPSGGTDVYLGPGERRFQSRGRSGFTWAAAHTWSTPLRARGLYGSRGWLFSRMVLLAVEITWKYQPSGLQLIATITASLFLFLEVAPDPFVGWGQISLESKVVWENRAVVKGLWLWSQSLNFPRQSQFPVLSH